MIESVSPLIVWRICSSSDLDFNFVMHLEVGF